jgi:hypothetical protein
LARLVFRGAVPVRPSADQDGGRAPGDCLWQPERLYPNPILLSPSNRGATDDNETADECEQQEQ